MTTQQPFPKNRVILYGVVGQRRYRDGQSDKKSAEPAIRRFRNPAGGANYSLALQVAAPYGGSYELQVEVGPVDGSGALEHARAGEGLVLCGHLSRTLDLDERFRLYDDEIVEGVFYQNVIFHVESVRQRGDGDPQGTGSNVAFEGTVVEPPIFFRHPDYPEIELARVGIAGRTAPVVAETEVGRPSRPCTVSVVIPTDDEQAGLLYRRGNRVQLRGVLERLATRSVRNKVVQDRLAALDTEWEERREEIRGQEERDQEKARRELFSAGSRYVRDRDRFSRIVRTVVVAIEVSPVGEAAPASREEAVEDRARFDAEQREERTRRREEQRARRRDNKRREALARVATAEEAGAAGEGSEASVEDTTVPGEPARPRRRPRVTEVRDEVDTSVPDTELDGMEPIDEVTMVHANGVDVSA